MTTKPLLLLTVLLCCCCISTLHAAQWRGCQCNRKTSIPIPVQFIRKIEVTPITGQCRHPEIMITRRRGLKVCVNPNAQWVTDLLTNLQRQNETFGVIL